MERFRIMKIKICENKNKNGKTDKYISFLRSK